MSPELKSSIAKLLEQGFLNGSLDIEHASKILPSVIGLCYKTILYLLVEDAGL